MDPVQRYERLVRQEAETPAQKPLPAIAGEWAGKVYAAAERNGFVLHAHSGSEPRLVIIGAKHNSGTWDEKSRLCDILESTMGQNDILLSEGGYHVEVPYAHYARDDLIGRLKGYFTRQGIRTGLNDDALLASKYLVASHALTEIQRQGKDSPTSAAYVAAVGEYMRCVDARDENFCNHEVTGMVPVVNGTVQWHKTVTPGARVFQLLGLAHVHSGVIAQKLDEKSVPYLMFVQGR